MIISYCVNPDCSNPKNHPKLKVCHTCGWGLILSNHYRVIKKIGQGGFGATFMGVDLTVQGNPLCVVKQLRPAAESPEAYQMALDLFKREAKTLEKISHPQIPKLLDYFVDNEEFYLVQELIKGNNLRREVKENGPFSEIATKRFLAEMLPVIQYLHSQKVIHRDLKPANILRRQKDQKLILIDFGAVKDQVNTQLAKTFGQTALTKFAVGTMGFAPPEQMAMRPIYASDIYALGATCVYLLTGKSPKDISRNPDTGALLWDREVQIGASFSKILTKMLEPNVRERFKRAEEVIEVLDISPFEDSLNQALTSKDVPTPKRDSSPPRLPNSQITKLPNSQITSQTSATQKLEQAVKERKSSKKSKNVKMKWTKSSFLTAFRNGKTDFSDQDLSHLNIENLNFPKGIFRYSNLENIVFTKGDFYGCNFYGANLKGANFKNSNLRKTYLSHADLSNANLEGVNLERANLKDANLTGVNLRGANLKDAEIDLEQLTKNKTNWATIYPDGSRKWWKIWFF